MSNLNLRRWHISRRSMLHGFGASLALPWMNAMETKAGPFEDGEAPRRSVFVYVPNGVNTLDWQVQEAGRDYRLSKTLEPLAKYRQQMSLFSGLHHPHGVEIAHKCGDIWLTGAKVPRQGSTQGNTVSVDQLMAQQAGMQTRVASLEMAITGGNLAWSPSGVPLPAERKPRQLFEGLFGLAAGGIATARRRLGRRANILDLVLEDARRFRSRLGNQDRSKLDEYLSAVRSVEQRTQRAEEWLDKPMPKIEPEQRARLVREIPDSEAGDYLDTLYDIILLALRTDTTRVITYLTGSESLGLGIPEIGIPQTRHELSHHNGVPEQMRRLSQTDLFSIRHLARFLGKLQDCDEAGVSLLDRTMVLYGSGMSYGHSHGNANLPILLFGGAEFGVRHGGHHDYNLPSIGSYTMQDTRSYYPLCIKPVDGDARLCNLLLSMLGFMGIPAESFGDSLRPLPGL